eukprot:3263487-Alexandrium_andersonii.AAC.1
MSHAKRNTPLVSEPCKFIFGLCAAPTMEVFKSWILVCPLPAATSSRYHANSSAFIRLTQSCSLVSPETSLAQTELLWKMCCVAATKKSWKMPKDRVWSQSTIIHRCIEMPVLADRTGFLCRATVSALHRQNVKVQGPDFASMHATSGTWMLGSRRSPFSKPSLAMLSARHRP